MSDPVSLTVLWDASDIELRVIGAILAIIRAGENDIRDPDNLFTPESKERVRVYINSRLAQEPSP